MTNKQSSVSGQTAATDTSRRIKNTFAPNCRNEYLTSAGLFAACKVGLSPKVLPLEARKMLKEYQIEYNKRCTKTGDTAVIPDLPGDIELRI